MANPDTVLAKPEKCSAPELYDAVTDFCFGHADETKRRLVEDHLIACSTCRRKVAKLTSAVEVLRFDQELMPPVAGHEAAAAFGLSSRLQELFAGHRGLALVSCAAYAIIYVLPMWVEISLQYERYATRVALGMPFVTSLMSLTTYMALKLCWLRVARGNDYSLTFSFLILLAATLTAYGLSWIILPSWPVNGFATPQEIYVQNIGGHLALINIYLLLPFHFIVSLQRELAEGRQAQCGFESVESRERRRACAAYYLFENLAATHRLDLASLRHLADSGSVYGYAHAWEVPRLLRDGFADHLVYLFCTRHQLDDLVLQNDQ